MPKVAHLNRIAHGLRTRVTSMKVSAPLVALVLITFFLTVIIGVE